ncbi:hypothetical protein ISF_00582 [Cordyceps fumosorosea ARSEF 2679]|uniref:Uncharacterized protein n=1 Tax=Cordyceps fumosorosea (strain ARSEF 2679) TaxID=1081104 RepID=A0A168EDG4_CORFA|nr:hypothetical protein ISF_00582 [Cordyceps fumosorosea ARSEF 2679]OAA73681.1 hypothetical protein ISF_00582 [Cordyceps fumosorosea ARSEF 2679]
MPEADDRHNAQQVSGNGEEYKFHFSGDRCCRIRNGIGSAKNLPNRSGWIPAIELPELSIIKRKFLKTHPEANWHLPWPPHDMGACSALRPIPEVAGVSEEGGGGAAGSGRCRGRGGAVPRWSYAASAKRKRSIMKKRDADDEYNSDGTNTTGADNELAAHGQSWIMHKKKRRRLDDATYRPQRDEHPDSDDEEMLVGGGAPERLRQVRHEMEQEISTCEAVTGV